MAVKPDVAEGVLRTLSAVGITRVLSIVAGLSTARLEAALGPGDVVVRAMPNTPRSDRCRRGRPCRWQRGDLRRSRLGRGDPGIGGTVVRLPERHLDAVTAVSGSGPAYVFLVAEAMIEAG